MLDAPGSLMIDVFIREHFTADSNGACVVVCAVNRALTGEVFSLLRWTDDELCSSCVTLV